MQKKTRNIVLAIFTFSLVLGSVTLVKSADNNPVVKQEKKPRCWVNPGDIISYLEGFGYSNIVLTTTGSGCDMMADTDYSYDTIIYCTELAIIGHEDLQ